MAAACLTNENDEILLVRKQGTSCFMQPGGKIEVGESPQQAIVREIEEELGISYMPGDLIPAGSWEGLAANEPMTGLLAYLFIGQLNTTPSPKAELEELLWITPQAALQRDDIAPLLREHVLPGVIDRIAARS